MVSMLAQQVHSSPSQSSSQPSAWALNSPLEPASSKRKERLWVTLSYSLGSIREKV
jgi:hypothetical protein